MATTVRMPEVLAGASEAAIQAWSVGVGDTVAVGQPFAEIETEKAVVEYAAETAGTVLQLLVAEGDSVDVGTPIAVVGEPGEVVDSTEPASAAPASEPPASAPPASAPPASAPVSDPDS
ncbi:MAG TPA: biotin/lipoyl-containing protein, partial [Agromyces sp.]